MEKYAAQAKAFCDAIRHLAASEESMTSLECYLSYHFGPWLDHLASTPEDIAEELESFAGEALPF